MQGSGPQPRSGTREPCSGGRASPGKGRSPSRAACDEKRHVKTPFCSSSQNTSGPTTDEHVKTNHKRVTTHRGTAVPPWGQPCATVTPEHKPGRTRQRMQGTRAGGRGRWEQGSHPPTWQTSRGRAHAPLGTRSATLPHRGSAAMASSCVCFHAGLFFFRHILHGQYRLLGRLSPWTVA